MKATLGNVTRHIALFAGILALIVLGMLYPFLPGDHDRAAMAASALMQMLGLTGLLLVPVGIAWLIYELRSARREKRHRFAIAAVIAGSVVASTLVIVAFASMTTSLGALVVVIWLYAVVRLARKLKRTDHPEAGFPPAPLYLILLPVLTLVLQLTLAGPVTRWSRNRAIDHSAAFRNDIDAFRAKYGRYPASLLAQWKDYYPRVIGVEKYHFTSFGDSYNLFFEQPRFLLDDLGTREWVVYNPRDEHLIFSHTSWFLLLPPGEVAHRAQGWYAVQETGHPHWKSFLFD